MVKTSEVISNIVTSPSFLNTLYVHKLMYVKKLMSFTATIVYLKGFREDLFLHPGNLFISPRCILITEVNNIRVFMREGVGR